MQCAAFAVKDGSLYGSDLCFVPAARKGKVLYMTLKKKGILLSTAVFSLISVTARAAYIKNADLNLIDSTVTVSGINFDKNNGEYATVLVLKPGIAIDNMTKDGVEKQEQIKIKDGKFEYEFLLNSPSDGEYTAYINAGDAVRESKFTYAANVSDVYSEVMKAADSVSFAELLEKNANALNLNDTAYGGLDKKDNAGKMLYNVIKSGEVSVTDAESLKRAAVKVSMLEAMNESKKELVFDNNGFVDEKLLGMDTIDGRLKVNAYSLFNEKITENGKSKALSGLCSAGFDSISSFEKEFVWESTKVAIRDNKSNGTGHISAVLDSNNAVNGLNLNNYKSVSGNTINNKLISGNYETKAQMQSILDTKVSQDSGNTGPGSGSNTSGTKNTGSGYSSGVYSPTTTVTNGEKSFVFKDVTENYEWAKPAIEQLYIKGIIKGRSADEFAPAENVTRAEFVKMILGVFGIEANGNSAGFEDVTSGDWYAPFVNTAYELGIVTGMNDTYFGANENITRQDAAVIIQRACKNAEKSLEKVNEAAVFDDAEDISEYAVEAINELTEADILHGSDNKFNPRNNCTRAEAAVMLKNVSDKING